MYEQILEHTIISAVDALLYHQGKILLCLQNQEPCKGQWWFSGGRQYKGETGEEAVIRKIKEETGLDIEVKKLVGVYDIIFDKTAFKNVMSGVHYLARVFLVNPKNGLNKIKLDTSHTTFRWIGEIKDGLHDYIKTALLQSGVFEKK